MHFRPTKSMFGSYFVTTRNIKVKPSEFDFLTSWKPFIDRKTMKVGFKNTDPSKPTIDARFDSFSISGTDTIFTRQGERIGLITHGGEKFKPEFTSLSNYGDCAIVTHGTLKTPAECGVVDLQTGEYLIKPIYSKITPNVSPSDSNKIESFSAEREKGKVDLLTTKGKAIIPHDAEEVHSHLFDGQTVYTYFSKADKGYLLVDSQGQTLLKSWGPFQVHHNLVLTHHLGGSYVFAKSEEGYLQDIMSSPNNTLAYLGQGRKQNELLFKQEVITGQKDEKGHYIKRYRIINQLNQSLTDLHQDVDKFDEEYFKVKDNDQYGLVDAQTGAVALPCEYEELLPMFARPNFAKKQGLWGVLGKGPEFKQVVPFEYNMNSINRRQLTMDATDSQGREVSIEIGRNNVYVSTYTPTATEPVSTVSYADTYRELK